MQIKENTPEAVEYRGVQNLVEAVKEHLGYRDGKVLFQIGGETSRDHMLAHWAGRFYRRHFQASIHPGSIYYVVAANIPIANTLDEFTDASLCVLGMCTCR